MFKFWKKVTCTCRPRPSPLFCLMISALVIWKGSPTMCSKAKRFELIGSCICKPNGGGDRTSATYDLTSIGSKKGKQLFTFVFKKPVSEYNIKYFYNPCYPFTLKMAQPGCYNSSLCQFSYQDNKLRTVTTQEHDTISCRYNKSVETVQLVYKGVQGSRFEKGGLVVTLKCDKQRNKPDLIADLDIIYTKGKPWKYITISYKCFCPGVCTAKGPPKKEPWLIYVIVGASVLLVSLITVIICRIYGKMSNPYSQFRIKSYGSMSQSIICYHDIEHIKSVGEGAFGVVSKGRWRNTDVAVKRLKETMIFENIQSFQREFLMLSNLHHPNIVQFMGVCLLKPNLCIVTEFMEGGSVANIIHRNRQPLSWKLRIDWAIDAAKGMAFLHSHKPPIIHRDLKSDNLLVNKLNLVKVGDFGTTKFLLPIVTKKSCTRTGSGASTHSQAQHDTLWVGTLRWCAPEVIPYPGEDPSILYTPKADVYSYGITLWEMFSNRRPYMDYEWDWEIEDAIRKGSRPDVPNCCSPHVGQFLESCWNSNPVERPSFEGILVKLNELKNELDSNGHVHKSGPGTWPPLHLSKKMTVGVI